MKFEKGNIFSNEDGKTIQVIEVNGNNVCYAVITNYSILADAVLEEELKKGYYHKIN